MPISTRYIYGSEEEAKADVTLFRWYHGDKTNEPGETAMPEPLDEDWICKPRETVSWTVIIAHLEVEGGQLSPIPKRLKKASGLGLKGYQVPFLSRFTTIPLIPDYPTMRALMIGWKSQSGYEAVVGGKKLGSGGYSPNVSTKCI